MCLFFLQDYKGFSPRVLSSVGHTGVLRENCMWKGGEERRKINKEGKKGR